MAPYLHLWLAQCLQSMNSWSHAVTSMTESSLFLIQCYLRAQRPLPSNNIFGHVFCKRCLHILRIVWWYYVLYMMEYSKSANLCWRVLLWFCFTIYRRIFLQTAKPLPIFTPESLCLSKGLFSCTNHVIDLLPVIQISSNVFLQPFMLTIADFALLAAIV